MKSDGDDKLRMFLKRFSIKNGVNVRLSWHNVMELC